MGTCYKADMCVCVCVCVCVCCEQQRVFKRLQASRFFFSFYQNGE